MQVGYQPVGPAISMHLRNAINLKDPEQRIQLLAQAINDLARAVDTIGKALVQVSKAVK